MRSKQRWQLEKARNVEEIIIDTFNVATPIGEFIGDRGENVQYLLDKRRQRALIYDPNSDTVVTVYSTKQSPLAPMLYESVIDLHKRQIAKLERKYKSTFKQYNREREMLENERRILDEEIQRMKIRRDEITARLNNYEHDLSTINMEKRSVIRSMGHYLSSPENVEIVQEG